MSEKPKTIVKNDQAVHASTVTQDRAFLGFQPPTSNTTYTPNQFFDVCLPYRSRGCVRLIAYMIRRSLGWCDANGNPQEDQLVISYNDLVENVGISRGAIGDVLQEAIKYGFITCLRKGQSKAKGKSGVNALFELRWDNSAEYVKDPSQFRGFFEGDGNRTDIPNEFFDVCVKNEPLAVTKVVGSIVRFSIGFQTRRGSRRQQVALSYNDIQRYAKIGARRHLASALQHALEQNYIVRIQEGLFTPDKEQQLSTTYAVKWSDKSSYNYIGSKRTPENRFKKDTSNGSKRTPENRFKKDTSIETKLTNEISKQQQVGYAAPAAANREIVSLLIKQGFSTHDAQKFSEAYPEDQIRQQVEWLPQRNPGKNPTGLLRKAIELSFGPPPVLECQSSDIGHGQAFAAHFYAGLAGNQGEPVVQPSSKEAVLAEGYVTRLLQVWQDESKIAEWGRDFGQHVAVEVNGKKGVIPSLTFALNASPFGEQFYKQLVSERVAKLRQINQRRKEEHQRRYWKTYLAYLKTEHTRLAQENPERLQEFKDAHAAERDQIKGYRISEEFHRQMLQDHDSPKTRRAKFAEFFGYSFWKWDAEINEDSFKDTEHP